MLKIRKYNVDKKYNLSNEEFKLKYNKNKEHIILQNKDKFKIIHFLKQKKIKPSILKDILANYIKKYGEKIHFIFLFKTKINSNLKKVIKKFINKNVRIEVFLFEELIIDKIKHKWVPKHELITNEEEYIKIKEKYNIIKKYQLPLIFINDPIAKYYGAIHGQIFKITRMEDNGFNIIYRYVIKK